ncbi:hypothetical protein [Hoylesella saccharolytica]|uniref:hypothetical protein n=1 Tax=Hoylesella saccharolytica TaxID=633701 RepID=UPI0028D2C1C3|nr:hypothetical protein [Hoylesella saccharolytica]
MIKRVFLIAIIMFALSTQIWAQQENKNVKTDISTFNVNTTEPITHDYKGEQTTLKPVKLPKKETLDSLYLPTLNHYGQMTPLGFRSMYWPGWNHWSLHRGLNLNLGASVFTQLGKHAHHGTGFAQSLSAMYAVPLTHKLTLAVGGYFSNIYWTHNNYRDAGLNAVLGYQLNEHWETYIYAQKSLVKNPFIPYSIYDINALGDRIGAAVKYNFNPYISLQISVEHGWMPNRMITN